LNNILSIASQSARIQSRLHGIASALEPVRQAQSHWKEIGLLGCEEESDRPKLGDVIVGKLAPPFSNRRL